MAGQRGGEEHGEIDLATVGLGFAADPEPVALRRDAEPDRARRHRLPDREPIAGPADPDAVGRPERGHEPERLLDVGRDPLVRGHLALPAEPERLEAAPDAV